MTDKRVLILEDGQVTIGGVEYVLVPVEPSVQSCDAMLQAIGRGFDHASQNARGNAVYAAYVRALSAAAIDLSGLPRVPERRLYLSDSGVVSRAMQMSWNDALDAMGIK